MKGDMRRLFQSKGWTHCGEDMVWSSAESYSGQAHSRPEWTRSTQLCLHPELTGARGTYSTCRAEGTRGKWVVRIPGETPF